MKAGQILNIFPNRIRERFCYVAEKADDLREIRLITDRPVRILCRQGEFFLSVKGELGRQIMKDCWRITAGEIELILNHICSYSRYAYEEDIKQGFLTVPGGHRIGVAGQVILGEDGRVRNMKYIRCLNIRVSHEIIGAADQLLPLIHKCGILCNTLLVAPPGCGKTTMLRDLIRQLSNGSNWAYGRQVGVVDERSEIAGSYMGVPGNDLGIRTDVLDGCPKVSGMMMLTRSMTPEVMAVDEIGSREDLQAIRVIMQSGCKVIATMHGASMEDVQGREMEKNMFDRFVFLEKTEGMCRLHSVLTKEGEELYV